MAAVPALLWTSEEQCKMRELLAIIAETITDVGLKPEVAYPDAGDFLPVAAICTVSIFLSVLWLIWAWRYVLSRQSNHESDERALRADTAGPSASTPR